MKELSLMLDAKRRHQLKSHLGALKHLQLEIAKLLELVETDRDDKNSRSLDFHINLMALTFGAGSRGGGGDEKGKKVVADQLTIISSAISTIETVTSSDEQTDPK